MKFLCEHCGHLNEASSLQVRGEGILVTCGQCGAESAFTAGSLSPQKSGSTGEENALTSQPSSETVAETPEQAPTIAAQTDSRPNVQQAKIDLLPVCCPKCFHRQLNDDFCHRCGLDLHWAAAQNPSFTPEVAADKEGDAEEAQRLWSQSLTSTRSQEAHDAYVAFCTQHDLLDLAMWQYRQHLANAPHDAVALEHAQETASRLENKALALLLGQRWAPQFARRTSRIRMALLVLAAILFIIGLVLAILVFTKQSSPFPSSI